MYVVFQAKAQSKMHKYSGEQTENAPDPSAIRLSRSALIHGKKGTVSVGHSFICSSVPSLAYWLAFYPSCSALALAPQYPQQNIPNRQD